MSGHSKWANIKRKKGATDAARGKIFTKIGREMAVAVRDGGSDPNSNPKLRDCIAKARANNMPNDNIQRVIKKAAGEIDIVNYEEIVYEGYGAGGAAFIVYTLTDNKNRTAGDVRHAFDKHGGSLGTSGCVSYLFERKGTIILENTSKTEDEFMEDAIAAGVDDYSFEDEAIEITTKPEDYQSVLDALTSKSYQVLQSEIGLLPASYIKLDDANKEKVLKLIEMLEDHDDVQEIFHNVEDLEEE